MLPQRQVRTELLTELDVMGEKHNVAERRERLSWSSSLPSLVRQTKQPPCSHPPMGIVSFQPLFILAGNALVSCSFNHVTWTIPTAYILIYLRFTPHAADRLTFVKLKLCVAFPYSDTAAFHYLSDPIKTSPGLQEFPPNTSLICHFLHIEYITKSY